MKKLIQILPIIFLMTALTACDEHRGGGNDIKASANDVLNDNEATLGNVVFDKHTKNRHFDTRYEDIGYASWYGPTFHGKRTANGSVYDQNGFTAAHPDLPMPSVVRVSNIKNNKSVLVVVNDRGPNKASQSKGRIIDLSKKAAKELGFVNQGIAEVKVEYLHNETLALLKKYPNTMQARANKYFQETFKRHMVELNNKAHS
jgi:rare lipoprotein A (peptidoglycan hydrolase)